MNANRREMSDLDLSEEKKEIRAFSSLNASSSEIAFVYKLSKYSCILQGLEAGHRYVIRDTIYMHELERKYLYNGRKHGASSSYWAILELNLFAHGCILILKDPQGSWRASGVSADCHPTNRYQYKIYSLKEANQRLPINSLTNRGMLVAHTFE